jgi:uncharacterized protein (TIGR03435 family)
MNFLGFNDRLIIDATGFEGEFEYNFVFQPDTNDVDELQAKFRLALSEQLGMRLEARKAAVSIMVIDHIDKIPTARTDSPRAGCGPKTGFHPT